MRNSYSGKNSDKRTMYSSKANVKSAGELYTDTSEEKRKQGRFEKKKKRDKQQKIIIIIGLVIIMLFSIWLLTRKNAINIYVEDHYVGMVKNPDNITAEDLKNSATAQLVGDIGTNVLINQEIKIEHVRANSKELVTIEYALSEIKRLVTYKVEAAVITVDGGEILALSATDEAQRLLDEIVKEYVPDGVNIVESGFVENVQIVAKFVASADVMDYEKGKEILTIGTSAMITYTIATGDNLYKIASKNGITVEEILEANPQMTVSTPLKIGDKLNLKVLVPFLSVKTAENVVFTERQEKGIEYREDSSKPLSYKRVIQQGRDGQKEVTTQIIRVNGSETAQKVVSEKITVDPVTEIIAVGTR